MDMHQLVGAIEAILFVAGEPVPIADIAQLMNTTTDEIATIIKDMELDYINRKRGLRISIYGDRVQITTRNEYYEYIEEMFKPVKKKALSQAVMETLAIIAYKQPITRGEIEAIRGVKCDYAVQILKQKELVREDGYKPTLGRPALLVTTDELLRYLDIASLDQLPLLPEIPKAGD